MARTVRIGCHSGFWGDTETAAAQLVRHGNVDYLVSDYLAEVTMSIMAAQKLRNPQAGYATDFVTAVMGAARARDRREEDQGRHQRRRRQSAGLPRRGAEGLRGGGRDAQGRASCWATTCSRASTSCARLGIREMDTGAELPARIASMNAYLGGFPIARALAEGADVVITGRCVDSAVTLGALIHDFGWSMDDHDRLAAGTLCGHIIECGAQCNGGNFTDWRLVPDYDNMGFPIAEVEDDGSLRARQARRHRRADHAGDGGRADALRDRRSARLHRARRGLRLHRRRATSRSARTACACRAPRAGRRPTPTRSRRPSPTATSSSTIFMLGGREAVAKGRHSAEIDHQEDAPHVRREGLGRLPRRQHRGDRRRGDLRAARAHRGQPRGRGQDRRQARPEGGAGAARPRDRADVDRRRGRHDRQLRRRPRLAVAGDPHVLLPGAEEPWCR